MSDNEDTPQITLEILYQEIINTKQELKDCIAASEARSLLKTEELRIKVKKIEEENNELQLRIEKLEREVKKKNLMVFGLNIPRTEVCATVLCEEINKLLDAQISATDIDNFYHLRQAPNSPLKIEFHSQITKLSLLKKGRRLKGTKISISPDLSRYQQEEKKILLEHLKKASEITTNNCYIRGSKLYINQIPHTIEELNDSLAVKFTKPSSAPSTPSTSTNIINSHKSDTPIENKSKVLQGTGASKSNKEKTDSKVIKEGIPSVNTEHSSTSQATRTRLDIGQSNLKKQWSVPFIKKEIKQ